MRPESYSRWVDPAPLEVERPRLPWWTLLPRKLLLILSPVIVLAVALTVTVFLLRRIWRYPLFLLSGSGLAALGIAYSSWWASAGLLAGLAALGGLWAWVHPDSFARTVTRQARSEWRRVVVYAFRWRRVMLFSELTKRTGHGLHRVHYPKIRRVRSDGWRDRVSVRLLHGQCAESYAAHADALAHSFGARSCRVRADRPRRIWLDLVHTDPLATPLGVRALADPGSVVDLSRVVIGRTEIGRAWTIRLLDRHLLDGMEVRAGASPHVIVGCRAGEALAGRATDVGGPSAGESYECRVGRARTLGRGLWSGRADRAVARAAVVPGSRRDPRLAAGAARTGRGCL